MIKRIEINYTNAKKTDKLDKYISKKIGRLDRFLSRHARKSVHAVVTMKQRKTKTSSQQCEAHVYLPGKVVSAKEATDNMFSTIDIIESKLISQLEKYKTKNDPGKTRKLARQIKNRLRRAGNL